MSDKVVSFRQGKKRLARSAKEKLAEQNRAKFGRTKAEKLRDKTVKENAKTHLDGHKRED